MTRRSWEARLGACVVAGLVAGCGTGDGDGDGITVAVDPGLAFAVEVADSPEERTLGLSGRDEVPTGTGMLFRFDEAAPRSFWMADTRVPLDLAWIRDGRVIGTVTLQPCRADPCPSTASPGDVDAVLEVPAGELSAVRPGAAVIVAP